MDGRFGAPEITEEDIHAFARTYLGSDIEREDLLRNYRKCKGKMEQVQRSWCMTKCDLTLLPCSSSNCRS